MEITIKEVRELKQELHTKITKEITDFEITTGLTVVSINIDADPTQMRYHPGTNKSYPCRDLTINIEL